MSVILHSDLNNFYATCECLVRPELCGLPVVVCGKIKDRHGVVLAKNYMAKNAGIKTGMTLFEAKKLLPNIVAVEANHRLYYKYSQLVRSIYYEYTDKIEPFGIDEAWLDVTDSIKLFGSGENIANIIRERVKKEIGLTISVGVSFNKIFAKLGSDMKKPDAVTVISKENYKDTVWKLNIEELLFIGRATKRKLNDLGIYTIGNLASFDFDILKRKLGKWGEYLWNYANGYDESPVATYCNKREIKSVGNSLTFYRDLSTIEDIEALIYLLAESIAHRMKEYKISYAKTVKLWVENNELENIIHQGKFLKPSNTSFEIGEKAIQMFNQYYSWTKDVRAIGVSVCDFTESEQLNVEIDQSQVEKFKILENTIEGVRSRYGKNCINRGLMLTDPRFSEMDIGDISIETPFKTK